MSQYALKIPKTNPKSRHRTAVEVAAWERIGWDDGRSGKQARRPEDTDYMTGFLRGECALEECENGCGWREDEGWHY